MSEPISLFAPDDGKPRPESVADLIAMLSDLDGSLPVYFTYDGGHVELPLAQLFSVGVRQGGGGRMQGGDFGLYLEAD